MRFFCSRVTATRRAEVSSTLEGFESDMGMDRYSSKEQCYGGGLLVIHGGCCHCLMVERMYVFYSTLVLDPEVVLYSSILFLHSEASFSLFEFVKLPVGRHNPPDFSIVFPFFQCLLFLFSSRLVSSISLFIILVILTLYPIFSHYFHIKIKFCR